MRWLFYFLFFLCFANSQFAQNTTASTSTAAPTSTSTASKKDSNEPPELGEVFKPKVAIGTGMLSFFGDLYDKHNQAPWTARVGYDFNMSHRLNRYLQVNFNVMFGKLGADENTKTRHENFQSEIRSGGVNLMYDFGNFFKSEDVTLRPWISAGFCAFEFLSKTDLYDKNGQRYYYWSDGSIKNMPEGSANSQNAKTLVRDYTYETDIRERNADGFGKYRESAWAFPIGAGALMKITDRFDFKIGVQYYFTTTDYIDGITNKSVGNRAGTKGKDKFVYTSFSIQYDLVVQKNSRGGSGGEEEFDWLALDNEDYDKDGVRDWDDKCHGTPPGVKVDQDGCPLDDDGDGVPNYRDDENPSPKGYEVNMYGVALTDEYWQNWYDHYFDSIGIDKTTEVIGNAYAVGPRKVKVTEEAKLFTVELARYKGGVPSDEMALLLSVGDIRSTTLDDGTTVVYTAGTYDDVLNAVTRRDEFVAEGNKNAKVGYFKSDKYMTLTDDQLQRLIKEAKDNSLRGNTSIAGGNNGGNNGNNGGNAGNNGGNSGNNGNNGGNNGNNGGSSGNNGGNGNNSGNNGVAGNNGGNSGNNGNNGGNSGNNGNNGGNSGNNGNNGGNSGNNGNSSGNNGVAGNNGGNSGNNGSNSGGNSGNRGGNSGNNGGASGNSGNNGGTSGGASGAKNETFAKGDIVYRVQLGAYKNKISPGVFKGSTSVIELKTEDNYYRYVTNGFKTIEQAASLRADLVVMGYTDAFVTAYRNGKRIPMTETKATVMSDEKEDLNENKTFSTIDKSLIHFKIQLGALKKPGSSNDMEERVKDLPDVEKQGTASGMIRYTTGQYNDYQSAEKARKDLEDKGFPEAFIIATFKNEIISIQEAMELLK